MKLKNIFHKKTEIETGTISLTFKMPLINFLNYFKSNHDWSISFSDDELTEIEKAVKKAREGKSQELIFEDGQKVREIEEDKRYKPRR